MPFSRFILIIPLVCIALPGIAQYKYEKEIRINQKQVPENALRFVDSMQLSKRIKWYKEIGYNKISFEAKARYNGNKISIEFTESGTLEDAEIEIKTKDISKDPQANISQYLASQYGKYSIEKVQIQYSGDPNTILDFFNKGENNSNIIIRLEIVISAKVDGSYARFEFLFSETGEFIQKLFIPAKMNDNIEY